MSSLTLILLLYVISDVRRPMSLNHIKNFDQIPAVSADSVPSQLMVSELSSSSSSNDLSNFLDFRSSSAVSTVTLKKNPHVPQFCFF